jgi:adenylylsulfate kinase
MMKGKVFWFTGLSGSGKTTVAEKVAERLRHQNMSVSILDGDCIRDKRKVKLGFSQEDIKENNRLILEECCNHLEASDAILVPVITPFEESRLMIKKKLNDSVSIIYCSADLISVSERDVKGLYRKADQGLIKDMIGYPGGQAYDTPSMPDLILKTGINGDTENVCVEQLYDFILNILKSDEGIISE